MFRQTEPCGMRQLPQISTATDCPFRFFGKLPDCMKIGRSFLRAHRMRIIARRFCMKLQGKALRANLWITMRKMTIFHANLKDLSFAEDLSILKRAAERLAAIGVIRGTMTFPIRKRRPKNIQMGTRTNQKKQPMI